MSSVNIKGLAELKRALELLPAKIENNILRGALRAGCKVLANAAKQNIHNVSGDLAASMAYGVHRTKKDGTKLVGFVSNDLWYARMVELGTAAHWIRVKAEARPSRMTRRGEKKYGIATLNRMAKRGSLKVGGHFIGASQEHPGSKKKPFMRTALDQHGQAAVERVREYIRKRLADKHGINVPGPDE